MTTAAAQSGGRGGTQTTVEHLTDLGNARRLVRRHGGELRYCAAWRSWLVWSGERWRRDDTGEVERLAKQTVASIYAEAESCPEPDERRQIAKHAMRSEAQSKVRAMIESASTERGIAVRPADLDADAYLLSCANGSIDLRTGELRPADPGDLLTRGTDVEFVEAADCPRWRSFLDEVFAGDEELVAFVQRFVGYSLTGDTREHALAVLHGSGCNGKSTLVEIVKRLLGGLSSTASFESFVRTRGDRGPRNDLARLHRARMVIASESGKGRRLDEATIKSLTGGDTATARFLYAEEFEFVPEFKLWLVTNHRPRVDGGDDAIWRRLHLIPFEVSFLGREDRELRGKLEAELPGILRWAVEGALTWQREGLGSADAVSRATAEYREDEDVLGAFLAERCETNGSVETAELRAAYENFCEQLGEVPMKARQLGRELGERGIRRGGKARRFYQGVRLR
jgi:putative DNA primase/helicase